MYDTQLGKPADDKSTYKYFAFYENGVPRYYTLGVVADEKTVAEIIQGGTWNCVTKSQLGGRTLVRTMRNTLARHWLQQEQQTAEQSLRKLSRAVEQSADTVVVTDRQGSIAYVYPAFEALTGYHHDEVCGKTPRLLKSGAPAPEIYQEMWKTILAGNV